MAPEPASGQIDCPVEAGDESRLSSLVVARLHAPLSSGTPGSGARIGRGNTRLADLEGGRAWSHQATRDAETMEARFYLNGEPLGDPVSFATLPTSGGRGMLYLGSDTADLLGYGYEVSGALDEVCIYDEVLGTDSITDLFALDDCASHGSSAPVSLVPMFAHEPAGFMGLLLVMLGVGVYGLRLQRASAD
ncbi:MAG TPA: hypothetical protein EYG54_00190 [Myxococcales bacterium]|nr:hypothetical protein [Myxococcales bacterium]